MKDIIAFLLGGAGGALRQGQKELHGAKLRALDTVGLLKNGTILTVLLVLGGIGASMHEAARPFAIWAFGAALLLNTVVSWAVFANAAVLGLGLAGATTWLDSVFGAKVPNVTPDEAKKDLRLFASLLVAIETVLIGFFVLPTAVWDNPFWTILGLVGASLLGKMTLAGWLRGNARWIPKAVVLVIFLGFFGRVFLVGTPIYTAGTHVTAATSKLMTRKVEGMATWIEARAADRPSPVEWDARDDARDDMTQDNQPTAAPSVPTVRQDPGATARNTTYAFAAQSREQACKLAKQGYTQFQPQCR